MRGIDETNYIIDGLITQYFCILYYLLNKY